MHNNPLAGVGLHAVGALSAASCYTPQKKTENWAWEVYWISQATVAWLILPIVFAFITVPDYIALLADCPPEVMARSFGLGALYGTGGLAFGLAIQYIGFSLTYSLAIGISAILGTFVPLVWTANDGFVYKLDVLFEGSGLVVLTGIFTAILGIFICGYAGMLRDQAKSDASSVATNFRVGLPLVLVAGFLSAVFKFSLDAGEPIAAAAREHVTIEVLSMNAIYPFSHGGCWLINLFWCLFLIIKNGSGREFIQSPGEGKHGLAFYYLMAMLSGAFWYFQFFFYGMGHLNLGENYGFISWAIHMSLLILFSNLYGYLFKEWEGTSTIPKKVLHFGMLMIVAGGIIMTWGNKLGEAVSATQ